MEKEKMLPPLSNNWMTARRSNSRLNAPSFPPGAGGAGGAGERAEGGQGDQPLVRELWFITLMAAVALLLLAVALGVTLHKVSEPHFAPRGY